MKLSKIALWVAASIGTPALAALTEVPKNDFGGSIGIKAEHTDNALKEAEASISEQQDQYSAGLFAVYSNDYLSLNTDYAVSEMRYTKDSQEPRLNRIGQSEFLLGKAHHPAELKISHSVQRLPVTSAALDLEANTDEKQVFSAQPGIRLRLSQADTIYLIGNATEVDYRFDEQKNSSRTGATLGFSRGLSPVDTLSLIVTQNDIEFEFSPDVDYSLTMAVLALETRLRRLTYRIELGQSRSDSSRNGVSEDPYYAIQLGYNAGHHQFSFAANQQMTDSSRGFDSGMESGGLGGSDVTAEQLDQVLINHADATWSSGVLCGRCQISISAFRDEHQYQTLGRDEERLGLNLSFNYQLTRRSTIGLQGARMDQQFVGSVNQRDYVMDQFTLSYRYRFMDGVNLGVFATQAERVGKVDADSYDELRGGMSLGYQF